MLSRKVVVIDSHSLPVATPETSGQGAVKRKPKAGPQPEGLGGRLSPGEGFQASIGEATAMEGAPWFWVVWSGSP